MGLNFAGSSRAFLLLMLSNAFCDVLLAGIRPSFMLDESSWQATNIVSARSTPEDGVFEVVESWKGDLLANSRISVPHLAPDLNAISISSYPKHTAIFENLDGPSLQIPRQPPGSSVVLFLKRSRMSDAAAGTEMEWKPANSFGDFKTSLVWIEGAQIYAFEQLMNPGPSTLASMNVSEADLRARVAKVVNIQADLEEASKVEDGYARATRLKAYVYSDVPRARQFALDELGRSGASGVETIRGMLQDQTLTQEAAALVKAYSAAGGEALGEDLNTRLREEIKFWRAKASTLPQGWWSEIGMPERESFQRRYMETYQLVLALQVINYPPALPTARELSSFWKSVPQLNDASGLDQIAKESDKLVEHLSH